MAPFFPIYIRRSDGKVEISSKGSREANQPTPAQLDSKPDSKGICDFYRECPSGDPKEVDWRRKLAGMLMRVLATAETKDKAYILAALPENYRVFEHIKFKASEGDTKAPRDKNNHAGGGNDRQDAYLYGHPGGRKKRYRSPAEFFPHLLWLATDEAGDTNNCSCKFCSPEELESDMTKDIKAELPPKQEPERTTARSTSVSSTGATRKPQSALGQASLLPRQRCLEQKQDQRYNEFFYRPGELVWFCRGQAWGIGVVTNRDFNPQLRTRTYSIQPMSHSHNTTSQVSLPQDQLRNWLAWSPPPLTHQALNPSDQNGNRVISFEDVNWQKVIEGHFGRGDVTVDSSILAAKMVETTYTLFDRIDAKTSSSGTSQVSEIYYNGIYLGGEKLWLGDPIRLRAAESVGDVFVLQSIIERSVASDSTRSSIHFIGDTYSLRPATTSTPLPSADNVPSRVLDDLKLRNAITSRNADSAKRHFTWTLVKTSSRLTISDVKGRWYESTLFTQILDQKSFESGKQTGELLDAGLFMNGQGDCNRPPGAPTTSFRPADIKCRTREIAFGKSVPVNFAISKGLDDPANRVKADNFLSQTALANGGQLGRRPSTPTTPMTNLTQQQQALALSQRSQQHHQQAQQHHQQQQQQAQQHQYQQQQVQQSQFRQPQTQQHQYQQQQAQQQQFMPQQQVQQQQQQFQQGQGLHGLGGGQGDDMYGNGQSLHDGAFDQYMQFDDNEVL